MVLDSAGEMRYEAMFLVAGCEGRFTGRTGDNVRIRRERNSNSLDEPLSVYEEGLESLRRKGGV